MDDRQRIFKLFARPTPAVELRMRTPILHDRQKLIILCVALFREVPTRAPFDHEL